MAEMNKATETTQAKSAVETTAHRSADATKKVQDSAVRASEAATDATRDIGETVANTAKETVGQSSKVADQGREVMMTGARTAASVSGRIADISYGRGHHMLASAVQAMDVYRDAAEKSAERVKALFSTYLTVGRGLQQMQHAWLEMLDNTLEHAAHKPQDLLRANNLVELAEVQRDLYLDAINHAFESSTRLLEIASRTTQDAARPLQNQ